MTTVEGRLTNDFLFSYECPLSTTPVLKTFSGRSTLTSECIHSEPGFCKGKVGIIIVCQWDDDDSLCY